MEIERKKIPAKTPKVMIMIMAFVLMIELFEKSIDFNYSCCWIMSELRIVPIAVFSELIASRKCKSAGS
ncbi:hypothetical protein Sinac_0716 [Singulisphaera acidiphila DSM 18658]|uniref:Uncharacterized protein n=1 Tax=Singulisphaera acidiphila (strain ATCC BAA-1392 / DSM 18658 / VKM B-2454 / MOB10) TaxID=886293 RepID=L0D903_SINAD|nr:hypothetical protein Sinac_0716 [Singulisphaera acidiphila DSM 18658]